MIVKGIIFEDFINYKKPSMVIEMPRCSFKCDKECGRQVCQNSPLASAPDIDVDINSIIEQYAYNDITEAVVFQGLEPFDTSIQVLTFVKRFRNSGLKDDIVIYTGYWKEEIENQIALLQRYSNIIIKFGRFIPDQELRYDPILGIKIFEPQYAERIS